MILAVIIKTFVLYCIVFVFLQILTICIHPCSPLCGRFKGADRAIYAVEPCGQGNIYTYIALRLEKYIYIALWSITEEMFVKEIAFLTHCTRLKNDVICAYTHK